MRVFNDEVWNIDGSATASCPPIRVDHLVLAAIQAVWTGTPTGTLKVQASCDAASDAIGTSLTNWSDLSGKTSAPAGSSGSGLIELVDMGYSWIRLVYTRTSGSGSLIVRMTGKGM